MFDTIPITWLSENADVLPPTVWNDFFGRSGTASYSHYVTGRDGTRVTLLAGPFATDDEAQGWISSTCELLLGVGNIDAARSVRTTRLLTYRARGARPGDLNSLLGLPA